MKNVRIRVPLTMYTRLCLARGCFDIGFSEIARKSIRWSFSKQLDVAKIKNKFHATHSKENFDYHLNIDIDDNILLTQDCILSILWYRLSTMEIRPPDVFVPEENEEYIIGQPG